MGIQFFLLDSKAMLSVQQFSPSSADLVEVLPGLMPKIITRVAQSTRRARDRRGLIQDKKRM